MRLFLRLFASDMRYGLRSVVGRVALALFVVLLAAFLTYAVVYSNWRWYGESYVLSFGDAVLGMFGGMAEYTYTPGNVFRFPMAWFAMYVALAYITLDYPSRDLGGTGAKYLLAAGSRWKWWLSKCLWVASCGLLWLVLPFAVCCAATALTGGSWDFSTTLQNFVSFGLYGQWSLAEPGEVGAALTAIPFAVVAILVVQLAVSMFAGPYVALAVTIGILFFSAYYTNPWLLGNYLMVGRADVMMSQGGMVAWQGIALSLGVIAEAVAAGGIAFSRKDILGRRDDAS